MNQLMADNITEEEKLLILRIYKLGIFSHNFDILNILIDNFEILMVNLKLFKLKNQFLNIFNNIECDRNTQLIIVEKLKFFYLVILINICFT